jgi:hypothetical protein
MRRKILVGLTGILPLVSINSLSFSETFKTLLVVPEKTQPNKDSKELLQAIKLLQEQNGKSENRKEKGRIEQKIKPVAKDRTKNNSKEEEKQITENDKKAYDKGVLDTIKLLQNQADIEVPQTPYWLVIDVTNLGKGSIILKMVKLQRMLFNPTLIWFAGKKYIVLTGDIDPYHLKELKKNLPISFRKYAKVVKSKDFAGYRKLYISLTKECNYPLFTKTALIYTLEKRIILDVKNPEERRKLKKMFENLKKEIMKIEGKNLLNIMEIKF